MALRGFCIWTLHIYIYIYSHSLSVGHSRSHAGMTDELGSRLERPIYFECKLNEPMHIGMRWLHSAATNRSASIIRQQVQHILSFSLRSRAITSFCSWLLYWEKRWRLWMSHALIAGRWSSRSCRPGSITSKEAELCCLDLVLILVAARRGLLQAVARVVWE